MFSSVKTKGDPSIERLQQVIRNEGIGGEDPGSTVEDPGSTVEDPGSQL